MKILSLLLLFLYASLATAQTVPSSCDAPDSVKELYRGDAAWSAIISPDYPYYDSYSKYKDSIAIPLERYDSILRAIIAVKNALPYFPKEQSFYLDSVHQFSSVVLHEMYLEADTSVDWCRRLANKQFPTGNAVFDSLHNTYGITIYDPVQYPGQGTTALIFMKTGDFYNTQALARQIDSLPGIPYCLWALPFYSETHFLRVATFDSTTKLTFSYGWDNCRTYCNYRYYWVFTVFPDCSVRLDTSYGYPLPNLDVKDIKESSISLYPNPVTDKLIIEADERGTVIISDVSGNPIRTAVITEGKNEIVVGELPSGVYFITIRDRNGNVSTGRFIKM